MSQMYVNQLELTNIHILVSFKVSLFPYCSGYSTQAQNEEKQKLLFRQEARS